MTWLTGKLTQAETDGTNEHRQIDPEAHVVVLADASRAPADGHDVPCRHGRRDMGGVLVSSDCALGHRKRVGMAMEWWRNYRSLDGASRAGPTAWGPRQ